MTRADSWNFHFRKQKSEKPLPEYGKKDRIKTESVMGLGARRGAVITVKTEGPYEEAAAAAMEAFFTIICKGITVYRTVA